VEAPQQVTKQERPKLPRLSPEQREIGRLARILMQDGLSQTKAAVQLKVSRTSLYRYLSMLEAEEESAGKS
jgi:DNA-binding transcriptional regulator LsrR (DeoR family)